MSLKSKSILGFIGTILLLTTFSGCLYLIRLLLTTENEEVSTITDSEKSSQLKQVKNGLNASKNDCHQVVSYENFFIRLATTVGNDSKTENIFFVCKFKDDKNLQSVEPKSGTLLGDKSVEVIVTDQDKLIHLEAACSVIDNFKSNEKDSNPCQNTNDGLVAKQQLKAMFPHLNNMCKQLGAFLEKDIKNIKSEDCFKFYQLCNECGELVDLSKPMPNDLKCFFEKNVNENKGNGKLWFELDSANSKKYYLFNMLSICRTIFKNSYSGYKSSSSCILKNILSTDYKSDFYNVLINALKEITEGGIRIKFEDELAGVLPLEVTEKVPLATIKDNLQNNASSKVGGVSVSAQQDNQIGKDHKDNSKKGDQKDPNKAAESQDVLSADEGGKKFSEKSAEQAKVVDTIGDAIQDVEGDKEKANDVKNRAIADEVQQKQKDKDATALNESSTRQEQHPSKLEDDKKAAKPGDTQKKAGSSTDLSDNIVQKKQAGELESNKKGSNTKNVKIIKNNTPGTSHDLDTIENSNRVAEKARLENSVGAVSHNKRKNKRKIREVSENKDDQGNSFEVIAEIHDKNNGENEHNQSDESSAEQLSNGASNVQSSLIDTELNKKGSSQSISEVEQESNIDTSTGKSNDDSARVAVIQEKDPQETAKEKEDLNGEHSLIKNADLKKLPDSSNAIDLEKRKTKSSSETSEKDFIQKNKLEASVGRGRKTNMHPPSQK